jgi:hypothetical protein
MEVACVVWTALCELMCAELFGGQNCARPEKWNSLRTFSWVERRRALAVDEIWRERMAERFVS